MVVGSETSSLYASLWDVFSFDIDEVGADPTPHRMRYDQKRPTVPPQTVMITGEMVRPVLAIIASGKRFL